ncbi:MAG: ATP-binding cassette domain-containing protein [Anaerolineales bacterium]|jgi:ABC-2 type transport system ATP-binding protein|nr:ATP-binding cassette domain-containing protein [Anaerolineales bacterium]
MKTIEAEQIYKSFGNTQAVEDLSFNVGQGEIFGLLGPNGAGKTTTIRMLLDLFKPDRGSISILGGAMSEEKKARIGYMPEERGLYQDARLEDCLLYLALLKGMPEREARQWLGNYLERFELEAHKRKKVKELSKGMQQKAQIISTLVHQPELVIMDEPFSGLDPLNVQLVKELMCELRQRGVTIILSTHQMHLVEELCNRILLINRGRAVLYGDLTEIQQRFSGHAVLVRARGELPHLQGVVEARPQNNAVKWVLHSETQPQEILRALAARDIILEKFEIAIPSVEEIFIQVVEGGDEHE